MNGQLSMDSNYVSQVQLLLSVLPDIAGKDVFALKGGTAINLFCRNMQRDCPSILISHIQIRVFSKPIFTSWR